MGKWQLTMDPVQEWGDEAEDGVIYSVTLRRDPIQPSSEPQPVQYRTQKCRRVKAASPERLVWHLLDPENQDQDYSRIFLATYQAFICTFTLIKLLFQRDDMVANLDNNVCPRSFLRPLIQLWLDKYQEDLRDPPQHQALRLLTLHLRRRLCFRRLVHQAEALLKRFQDEVAEDRGSLKVFWPADTSPAAELAEVPASFMNFTAQSLAEQLTLLDAELFVKVVPFHCLGCVWSQRDKKDNSDLAPTIRATIAQFNAITNHVISSLLHHPSSPAQRAKVIEKWIAVAQECRELRNFSSLRAILSALQSNAVYRLRKTWAVVSRESAAAFDQLCETFPDENCVLSSREILVEEGSPQADDKSPQLCPTARQASTSTGVVPYLGTYLTALTMLDTALSDTVENGLINFEKRRREFEILSQIRNLQATCSQYSLTPHPHIMTWLKAANSLSDQESYELSRELEPPVDPCPSSPSSWSHCLIPKKISNLWSWNDGAHRKTHADQISVSSSGSSSSDLEDLSSLNTAGQPSKLASLSRLSPNVSEDLSSSSSSSSLSPSGFLLTNSRPDLSALNPDCSSAASSSSSSLPCYPVYNRQVDDSCIIRVSVDFGNSNNGNVYKSILLTSQDKTQQVVQRVLEKHNLEEMKCQDFTLSQVLCPEKELLIPDKANVFYAMRTTSNYDFVLRQRWNSDSKTAPILSRGTPH
ncbi:ral guanine nucleotide dissociation stimulator-like 1 isoform X2 [Denticeps clupeoides]|uniref:ral guanine nucleotide dissociation stimulator-like 1 isoform X2 n=1 Tax=Denticeps clupeoides TaxID=299321 RepID=UPI0010A58ACB|nr:ral guanine nucleotide dissociation stimulator-like 1 isoform X2 [Denticeps clupeoides]